MRGTRTEAARRKLLSILPRYRLEELSHHRRPHMLTRSELVELSALRWDAYLVKEEIDAIFEKASS